MNQDEIKQVVEEVLKAVGAAGSAASTGGCATGKKVTKDDYPLS